MVKKEKGKNMLNLGKRLAKQGKSFQLDQENIKTLKQQQQRDDKKVKLLRSIFLLDSHNNIKRNSIKNVVAILENDPIFKGAFQYNKFSEENEITKDISKLHINKGSFVDAYNDEIANYIESQQEYDHVIFDKNRIESAINIVSQRHAFNPMVDYMENAFKKYDGQRRLDDFFPKFLGVEKSAVTSLITRLWFMGGVAKVYHPLTKIDQSLDLVGSQGIGKTTLLQNLAPMGLYTDQFNSVTDKDDLGNLIGMFIVNDDEMTATSKSSFEEIKRFLTDNNFKYRPPYAKHPKQFIKKFIFARTTNNRTYLKDKTGTRRFLPLMTHKSLQELNPVTDLTPDYVQQLWGETVWLYKQAKDPFLLSPKQIELLENHRKNFEYVDSAEDELADVLYNDFHNADFIPTHELMLKLYNYKDTKIRNLMENVFNYESGKRGYYNGKRVRGFKKR
ncbi:VapE domain-containing protein [Lactobacillus amylovorus]|uniref:VapE domain-containing protein n=1 Tax=Lactobacillus amylovorus TaxID=1604 RepID=UPI00232E0479|nr:VapE domain-containing protein [Lactobacillus amylovorus]MDB6259361.1 virulence-associated E family protein [Lactobacillus amylovorus]